MEFSFKLRIEGNMAYTEVTFGDTGTYATIDAALTGISFTANGITEAYLNQVGASIEPNSIDISANYNGATIEIIGHDDYEIDFGVNEILDGTTTASLATFIFESINKITAAGFSKYTTGVGLGVTNAYFRRCHLNFTATGLGIAGKAFASIEIIQCDITSSVGSAVTFSGSSDDQVVYFENNMIHNLASESTTFENTTGGTMANFFVRRVYATHIGSATPFHLLFSSAPNWATEVFVNQDAFTSTDVTYGNVPFTVANFASVIEGEDDYGIPLPSSVLTTESSQLTDASENVIGINSIPVTTYNVGPYAAKIFILAPQGLIVSQEAEGVVLDWTNTSNASGYDRTAIYWKQSSLPGAFDTPDFTAAAEAVTYTIPYASLTASNIWFIRLEHAV